MALELHVDGAQLLARWNGLAGKVLTNLKVEMAVQTGNLSTYVQVNKLSGQVLKQRSGNLKRAMYTEVQTSAEQVTGIVGVDSTAPYGRYQELGAHIPERIPVHAKALRWYAGGKPVFAMRASAFTLPARPFLIPSLAEREPVINAGLQAALRRGIEP
jgi:hypothetical protein